MTHNASNVHGFIGLAQIGILDEREIFNTFRIWIAYG